MEGQTSFGEWLRARRRALDLTQLELAERAGCAEDTIGRIEAGTRRPSRQVAALLGEALGVPAQSQADFVRFAREGSLAAGSTAALGRIDTAPDTNDSLSSTQAPTRPASAPSVAHPIQPTRASTAAWVPYLSSLPHPPTLLIGREDEVAAAGTLLRSGQARLLTLTGPPGVGKTRLALGVASSLVPSFPDGICFVPLAPVRDPDLLGLTVAHALGLSDNSAGSGGLQDARLVDFLRHKRLLLVLDNFEHILPATERVGEWLSASAHLQVLVTSRSALHLRGERLFPVSTLPVPPPSTGRSTGPHDPGAVAAAAAYPSVALFVERAQAVDPQFGSHTTNWGAVVELCRRMEGLPLAIELTAARSARLAPDIVLGRLQRRLDVVTTGPRDLPDHQRTLRAAIEWSYDLLDEPERMLFERMSVFMGGATLDALEAVCNAQEDIEVGLDEALESLLQQSLVYRVTVPGEADLVAGRRFNMLEMLREYAAERLADREWVVGSEQWAERSDRQTLSEPQLHTAHRPLPTVTVKRYHAEYYLAMAEAAELQKWSVGQEKWLERLERDHDNLRAAIQWGIDTNDMNVAAGLCSALGNFWKVRGYLSEGRSWLDKVMANEAAISPRTLARVMNGAGVLARSQGDYEAATSLHERSVAIFRELDDKRGLADGLNNLGAVMIYLQRYDRAEELFQESLALWRAVGDPVGISKPLHNLAMVAEFRHDHVRSASLFRESLAMSSASGDKDGACASMYALGVVLLALPGGDEDGADHLAEAERCFTESLALARELGNKSRLALSLAKLGEICLERGDESDFTEAMALFEDSLALHKELGDRAAIAYTLNDMGHAALLYGDPANARSIFIESLNVSRTLNHRGHIARNLHGLAITMGAAALAANSPDSGASSPDPNSFTRNAGRAVQLHAAAAAAYTMSVIPVIDHFYQTTMDALYQALPRDEVETLQAQGQEMSLEEAIAFALDS